MAPTLFVSRVACLHVDSLFTRFIPPRPEPTRALSILLSPSRVILHRAIIAHALARSSHRRRRAAIENINATFSLTLFAVPLLYHRLTSSNLLLTLATTRNSDKTQSHSHSRVHIYVCDHQYVSQSLFGTCMMEQNVCACVCLCWSVTHNRIFCFISASVSLPLTTDKLFLLLFSTPCTYTTQGITYVLSYPIILIRLGSTHLSNKYLSLLD